MAIENLHLNLCVIYKEHIKEMCAFGTGGGGVFEFIYVLFVIIKGCKIYTLEDLLYIKSILIVSIREYVVYLTRQTLAYRRQFLCLNCGSYM